MSRPRLAVVLSLIALAALPLTHGHTVARAQSANTVQPLPLPTASAADLKSSVDAAETKRFILSGAGLDEQTRQRLLDTGDAAFTAFTELFGIAPEMPIAIGFYPDLQTFTAANPLAVDYGDGLAFARRRSHAIDLALPIANRRGPDGLATELRYELAQVFILNLGKGRLPALWQEGFARVAASSPASANGVARLRDATESGTLYRWAELSASGAEYLEPSLAYAEAGAIARWLAGTHGLTALVALIQQSSTNSTWSEAFQTTYGRDVSALESEWRGQLTAYLNGGWQRPAVATDERSLTRLIDEGEFEEARRRAALADAASSTPAAHGATGPLEAIAARAKAGEADRSAARQAAAALDSGNYAEAKRLADRLLASSATVLTADTVDLLKEIRDRASRGQAAIDQLLVAKRRPPWMGLLARQEAFAAAVSLAGLGNDAAADEARHIVRGIDGILNPLGWILILLGLGVLAENARRRRRDGGRGLRPLASSRPLPRSAGRRLA